MRSSSDSLHQLSDASGAQQLHIRDIVVPVIAAASSSAGLPSAGSQQAPHVEEAHAIGIQLQFDVVLQATQKQRPWNNVK